MQQASLIIASDNAGKLAEMQALLAPLQYTVLPQSACQVPAVDEPYHTFLENALHKARHASAHTGLPAIADDSGLVVPALGGAPGVYSARYAQQAGGQKSDAANNAYLIAQLSDKLGANFSPTPAYYVAYVVYVAHAQDPAPIVAIGRWQGAIRCEAMGQGGFGYDPHFYLPNLGKTVAELSASEKNALSHRGQALRQLVEALQRV